MLTQCMRVALASLILIACAQSANAAMIIDHSAVFGPGQFVNFKIVWDSPPDLTTANASGIPADEFRYLVSHDPLGNGSPPYLFLETRSFPNSAYIGIGEFGSGGTFDIAMITLTGNTMTFQVAINSFMAFDYKFSYEL